MRDLTRRTLLRGILGGAAVTLALPLWSAFSTPTEAPMRIRVIGLPMRFGLFTWGNGVVPERWVPSKQGSGDEWELSDELAPLAPHKEHITVITGLNVPFSGEGEPHFETACRFMGENPS